MKTNFIDKLNSFFAKLINHRYFDSITGMVSLINPLAALPQLWLCITMDNLSAVSSFMYIIFALLQIVFALIAIKARNLLMFLSMIASLVISITIIILTMVKGNNS